MHGRCASKRRTLKTGGQSFAVGILYVDGACVMSSPLCGCHTSSSVVSQPIPWMNAPSTWPMSTAGLSDAPASCSTSARSSFHSPVSVSITTSLTAAPYAK